MANISKELADFEFKQVDEKTEKIIIQKEGEQNASFELQANGFSLRGQGKFAKLNHIEISGGLFQEWIW